MHFGKSLLWAGEDALTLYILVRFLDLPPALAGGMFLASALWNALCDGLFGASLHRWPAIRRVLPPLSGMAILASGIGFAILPLLEKGHAVPAIALLFLFRTGFSLLDVPHNALTRRIAETRGDLGAAQVRAAVASAAAIVIGLVSFPVLLAGRNAEQFAPMLVAMIGLLAVICMAPLPLLLARDADDRQEIGQARTSRSIPSPLRIYCAATVIGLAGLAAAGKAMLHLDFGASAIFGAVLLVMTAGRLTAVWLWSPIARHIGSRHALVLAYAASGLAALMIPAVAQWSGPVALSWLILFSLIGGGIAFLTWAVLSEMIGQTGAPPEAGRYAAHFGLFTMSMKIGLGLSAGITGVWLSSSSQPVDIAPSLFWPLGSFVMLTCGVAAVLLLTIRPERQAADLSFGE
ncbi:MFS transporter [Novosphingobium sp. H3SJ31-1]|uniref:MFS transporter n=1 Tax=Novosphingobium album (ex Liu et al. 2023) TaxID=3031130 RepID=A0ABT5WPP0_9SPHN|nr:MFS transporter [Novosphingobium album (ex Liu et al. 2023)]